MRKYFTGECVPVTQVHIRHSFHVYTAHCFLDLVSFITYDITCPGRIYDKTDPLCSPKCRPERLRVTRCFGRRFFVRLVFSGTARAVWIRFIQFV